MFTLDRPSHQAPRRRFLEELEDHLGTSDAEHTLMAVTGWGRYAEVFSYPMITGKSCSPVQGIGASQMMRKHRSGLV